ncbi:MAG: exopolyphosphatase [Bacteroidota bacterium]
MKAAVIDLGTNTFHLIIAELTGSDVDVIFKTNLPVKLGEGRINDNIIIPEAFARGIDALTSFKREIDRHQVEHLSAIATSAVRSATNGKDFVAEAKNRTGLEINVISGDTEAEFIYQGVKATGLIGSISLIMDIGGGSTEFIICDEEKILWKRSYDLGAARLQQAYFHSDPISEHDQQAIFSKLETESVDLKKACAEFRPRHLIGSAGAFETFAVMTGSGADKSSNTHGQIGLPAYFDLAAKLINSTHEERETFEGLVKLRVDMIVIASLITNFVISMAGIEKLSLCRNDLKMGVLHGLISNT